MCSFGCPRVHCEGRIQLERQRTESSEFFPRCPTAHTSSDPRHSYSGGSKLKEDKVCLTPDRRVHSLNSLLQSDVLSQENWTEIQDAG